ncbi:MAG: sulfonate ABC transporter substrate-binding protein, partial [Janthinobacterium lividum]
VENRAFYFTSRDYVTKNDDVLRVVLDEVNTIDAWTASNRQDAGREFAALWGLDRKIVDLSLSRLTTGTQRVTREVIAEQQRTADTFFDLHLIPKKLNVADAAPSFARA